MQPKASGAKAGPTVPDRRTGDSLPTVSVIIPAYNAERFVGRALTSALAQTLPPTEVIVVDDGSTDGTAEVVASFRDQVRYYPQKNRGAAAARNAGVRAAKGEMLAFLDADDQWHPQKLAVQLAVLADYPDLAFCSCSMVRGISGEEPWTAIPPTTRMAKSIRNFREVFRSPYFGTPTILMPRRIFDDAGGFNERLSSAEDVDLWLRASYGRHVGYVAHELVRNFHVIGSLSYQGTFGSNISVVQHFCETHPDFAHEEARLIRLVFADLYTSWGAQELAGTRASVAADLLRKGLRQAITLRGLYLWAKAMLLGLLTYRSK